MGDTEGLGGNIRTRCKQWEIHGTRGIQGTGGYKGTRGEGGRGGYRLTRWTWTQTDKGDTEILRGYSRGYSRGLGGYRGTSRKHSD